MNILTFIKAASRLKIIYIFLSFIILITFAGCKTKPDNASTPEEPVIVSDEPKPSITSIEQDIYKDSSPVLPDLREITKNNITCTIDYSTGLVAEVSKGDLSLHMEGIYIDVGYNESYQFQQLGYTSFEDANTWELPAVWARKKALPDEVSHAITETDNGFYVIMTLNSLTVTYQYEMLEDTLKLTALITTTESDNQKINGVAFLVKGMSGFHKDDSTFEFPGSTPGGVLKFKNYNRYSVVSSDYACPLIQLKDEGHFQNIIFIDEHEKWSTGAFYDDTEYPCAVFLAAVEGYIKAGEVMLVGTLYLPLTPYDADPYLSVQDFYTELGYHTPENSINDGPVYSCHPYGTMDTGYFNRLKLKEYAGQLENIASMGFKNVWLLPVFRHTGSNVYEPIDQGVIDQRYGGEEEAKIFIDTAHELNLRVLFDLVPHGPRPVYSFAKENDGWISKDQEGNNQIEWECVSFDYNNLGYYEYTKNLLSYYAREFGLDGARIDCAMGGLSNWAPVSGLRASSSGLMGGVNITKAVKEGFLDGGVTPILLPENFHPIPYYAEYTDLFYDMPLFRMMHSLNYADITEAEYVRRLSSWLDAERKTSVKGQVKLRFLGNHDTVSWTFDAKRPQEIYGTEKAKALWSILSFIDGVPFIYQGDEEPTAYNLSGENLTGFFTDMLAARSKYIPQEYEIMYIDTGSPVFTFTRYSQDNSDVKLVLVNLSENYNTFSNEIGVSEVLYNCGEYSIDGEEISLAPYASVIIQIH